MAFRVWEGDNNNSFPMLLSMTNGGTKELIATGQVFSSFQVASNELSTPRVLVCPEDGARLPAQSWSSNFNDQTISYFLSLDASETNAQMFLSGDRNLTMNGSAIGHGLHEFTTNQLIGWTSDLHKNRGNIALADGSVQILSSAGLMSALPNTGVVTNRFAIP
ncbi:MAG TPA: type II secretion system protein [Verrucomicrobiae bacterium]|nr:type II secretion system protein [Verrucomicrobiae bacterium]